MNQHDRSAGEDTDEDGPDPWFRPVWDDVPDETDEPPPSRSAGPLPRFSTASRPADEAGRLLGPLAAAADALARLDAQAAVLAPALQVGLIARLAFAEAAGWLAAQGLTLHPLALTLRDTERLGRRELHARVHAAASDPGDPWWPLEDAVPPALHLARLLRRSPDIDLLVTAAAARAVLAPLGRDGAPFDGSRYAVWRAAHWPDGRRRDDRPTLLHAATAAQAWMERGIADRPTAAQALAAAHLLLRRAGMLRVIPLPVWAGWPALGAPLEPGALPRLRGDVTARLAPDHPAGGVPWTIAFLHLVTEAARAGSRTIAALRQAAEAGAALGADQDRRSRLPDALDQLLRTPAVTAAGLARSLAITPQAALRILERLVAAGIVVEVTGRKSFQAFAVAVGQEGGKMPSGQR